MGLGRCRVWVVGFGVVVVGGVVVWPVLGGVGLPLAGQRSSGVGFGESDPSGVGDDVESSFVDHHLVVGISRPRATQGSHHRSATAATLGSRILEPGLFGVVNPSIPRS
jgi:hypothetical protein